MKRDERKGSGGGVALPLGLAFFATGGAGLIDELVWSRMLANLFGSSLVAASVVFGLFMGGLAIGNALGGAIADRWRRPILLYAVCELILGVYTLATPALYAAAERWFLRLPLAGRPLAETACELAIAAGLLLPPVALMGATLPALAAALARGGRLPQGALARLYAVNTFGAVAGVLAAGFFLLPALGVRGALAVAAAIDIAAGLGVIFFARRLAEGRRFTSESETPLFEVKESGAALLDQARPALSLRRGMAIAGLAGFAALAAEVAWGRALGLIVGSSVYSIATLLAAFLTGLALGSWRQARLSSRVPDGSVPNGLVIGSLAARVAIAIAIFAAIYIVLPLGYIALLKLFPRSFFALMVGQLGLLATAILYPTTLMGALLPALVSACSGARGAGRITGRIFSANTLGAVAGALAAGFLLVPAFGVRPTLAFVTAVYLLAAWIGFAAVPGRESRRAETRWAWMRFALASALIWGVFPFALTRWNPSVVNGGYYAYAYLYAGEEPRAIAPAPPAASRGDFAALAPAGQVQAWREERASLLAGQATAASGAGEERDAERFVFLRDGKLATVAVTESAGVRSLLINGKADASNGWAGDMRTQLLLGHLPALAAPRLPRRALVIGLGSGVTAGALARYSGIEAIDVAEIEPAVVEASRYFDRESGAPLADARLHLSVEDARRLIFRDRGARYGIITSEPSNLWMSGVARLFTDEFFSAAAARLTPEGIFCQWIHLYQIAPGDIGIFLATFRRSFPHLALFADDRDLLVLGSSLPIEFPPDVESRLSSNPQVLRDLTLAGFTALSDLTTLRLPTPSAKELAHFPINTDNHPHLEFSAPRSATRDRSIEIVNWLRK